MTAWGSWEEWPTSGARTERAPRAHGPVARPPAVPPRRERQGAERPCLDYRSKSDKRRPGRGSRLYNRARVFRSGEVEVRSVLVDAASRPPRPAFGARYTRGVTRRGSRIIRRSVGGYVAVHQCSPVLYTLTTQHEAYDDAAFRADVTRWLKTLRAAAPKSWAACVVQVDLQQRGVLHAHVLLLHTPPPKVWARLRELWRRGYDHGPGSFDVKRLRSARRAAAYVSRYLTREHDDAGVRVGRNGLPYVRDTFRGNAYRIAGPLRTYGHHVTEVAVPWTHGPRLGAVNLRGCVLFFDTLEDAHAALSRALSPTTSGPTASVGPPPGVRSGSESGPTTSLRHLPT
jgi:hypothetical protein